MDGYITLTLSIEEEDGGYVSRCPELGVASCGDTLDEALHNIEEATLLYLDTIEEMGERERIFRERGIHIMPGGPRVAERPARSDQEAVSVRNARMPRTDTAQFAFC